MADRARLAALQTLFIRMLFCDRTLERLRNDPAAVAAEYGLAAEALSELPDPDSDQMKAERHGRRAFVLTELRRNFQNAWPVLEKHPSFRFEDFLSSDTFYDPASALPHPYGVGPGYENSSKFFFWARHALALDAARDMSGADGQLRMVLCADFAAYLTGQYQRGAPPFYDRFANGVWWRETPGRELPVFYMDVDRHLFRFTEIAQKVDMLAKGATELDTLRPEPVRSRPNIVGS